MSLPANQVPASASGPSPQYQPIEPLVKKTGPIDGTSKEAAAIDAKMKTLNLPSQLSLPDQSSLSTVPTKYQDLKSRVKTLNESVLSSLGTKNWGRWLSLGFVVGGVVPLVTSVIDWFRTRSLKQKLEKIEIKEPKDYDALLNSADLDTLSKNKVRMMKGALLLENGNYAEADRLFEEVKKDLDDNVTAHSFGGEPSVLCHYLAQAKAGCGEYEKAMVLYSKAAARASAAEERAFFQEEAAKTFYDHLTSKDQALYDPSIVRLYRSMPDFGAIANLVSNRIFKELQTPPINARRPALLQALFMVHFQIVFKNLDDIISIRGYDITTTGYHRPTVFAENSKIIRKFIEKHAGSQPPVSLLDAVQLSQIACNFIKAQPEYKSKDFFDIWTKSMLNKWMNTLETEVIPAYTSAFLDAKPPPDSTAVDLLILTSRDDFPLSFVNRSPVSNLSTLKPNLLALQKAIELGSGAAQYVLGTYYLTGCGDIPKDLNAARECFRKAIERGFKPAYQPIAEIAWKQGDRTESMRLLREGAAKGDVVSMIDLVCISLSLGNLDLRKLVNIQEAFQYIHQAFEQVQQEERNHSLVSLMPKMGPSILHWLYTAATQYPEFADKLKLNQYLGNDPQKLIDQGAKAFGEKDFEEACSYFLAVSQAGNKKALSDVATALGQYVFELKKDKRGLHLCDKLTSTMMSYYIEQAKSGFKHDIKALFLLYSEGGGGFVQQDWMRALAWLKRGGDLGFVDCQEKYFKLILQHPGLKAQVEAMAKQFANGENLYHEGFDKKVLEKGVFPPPSSEKEAAEATPNPSVPKASAEPASAVPSAPAAEPVPAELTKLIQKANDRNPDAMLALYHRYLPSESSKEGKSLLAALVWLVRAAKAGNEEAQGLLKQYQKSHSELVAQAQRVQLKRPAQSSE